MKKTDREKTFHDDDRINRLLSYLNKYKSVVLAYSGGSDSTLLLYMLSISELDRIIAVTALSDSYTTEQFEEAKRFVSDFNVEHVVIKSDEMDDVDFIKNDKFRCYFCKKELFTKVSEIAEKNDISAVMDGSTLSDTNDYRPGSKAASELNIISPFKENKWDKDMIRNASRILSVQSSRRPQTVCLASRVPYGISISRELLNKIYCAEKYMKEIGFETVRVRSDGVFARIEVPDNEIGKFCDERLRSRVVAEFSKIGFKFISADLEGFVSGKMNRQHLEK